MAIIRVRVEDGNHGRSDREEKAGDAEPEDDWRNIGEEKLESGDEELGGAGVGGGEGFEKELEKRSNHGEHGETEENAENGSVYDERSVAAGRRSCF